MARASSFERQMLELINEERANAGLQPLRLNVLLNESSEEHSEWMLRSGNFSHTGEGGSSATERISDSGYPLEGSWRTGENIAWQSERGSQGIEDDVRQLHETLMNSPGHRANILNPDFTEIGIGIERGTFRGTDAVIVTQNFAVTDGDTSGSVEPDGTPAPDPTPTPQPDPTPEPDPQPEPEPTPDPVPTPEPDPTPNPVPTPEPDPTPEPEPEPEPTPDPVPTPVPDPTPEPEPTPEPKKSVSVSGFAHGTAGDDNLVTTGSWSAVFAGAGNDTVTGNDSFDFLNGGAGDDLLSGGGGTDYLIGGRGKDVLDGGDGQDFLIGGAGDDMMTGGQGSDLFLFSGGNDTITDFTAGEDTLFLHRNLWEGGNPAQSWQDNVTVEDGNTVVDFGAGNTLTLNGITDLSTVDTFNLFC
jgi:hypothetical protein